MRIRTKASYNLDALCFLNSMTADPYYVDRHREAFDVFYPRISEGTKESVRAMVGSLGHSMLAPTLTLLVSSLDGFEERALGEMLADQDEIRASMRRTPYTFSEEEYAQLFRGIDSAILPLVAELEAAGFRDFWRESRLPVIEARRGAVDRYMEGIDVGRLISRYRRVDSADFEVYVCTFAKPHGIKLCGNRLITDCAYPDETILSNVTHEAFHPAFDFAAVKPSLDALAQRPWVRDAFDGQDPHSGYHTMEGFIEEHIVEALGIYVLVRLGVDMDPMAYFRTHDGGSHVLSPHFYRFLRENEIGEGEAFEAYFDRFARGLRA